MAMCEVILFDVEITCSPDAVSLTSFTWRPVLLEATQVTGFLLYCPAPGDSSRCFQLFWLTVDSKGLKLLPDLPSADRAHQHGHLHGLHRREPPHHVALYEQGRRSDTTLSENLQASKS